MITTFLIDNNYCEYDYLIRVSELLSTSSLRLIVTSNPYSIPEESKDTIVILTSDEVARIPSYKDSVLAIFRMYNTEDILFDNIYPIPLGIISYKYISSQILVKKDIDAIFLGQDTGERSIMFSNIEKSRHNIYFRCSGRHTFRQGVSIEDYISLMLRSKISLAPNGYPNFETSRYSESFALGCNVICPKRPNFWYYNDSPYYTVNDDWSNLDTVIDECLSSENNYDLNKKYYEDKLSPEATAKYILQTIGE